MMNKRHICKSLAIALPLLLAASLLATDVTHLRCEDRENPLGIDVETPRLSWVMEDLKSAILNPQSAIPRGQKQTAYQMLVASTPEKLAKDQGNLWDNGKKLSDQSIHVEYADEPLVSRQRCHWKVRVWDKDGTVSAWSDVATWTMGLLTPDSWKAKWIGAVAKVNLTDGPRLSGQPGAQPQSEAADLKPSATIQLRKEFSLEKEITRAVAYVCGLGFYELRLNGQKVGDQVLDPGWTNYRKTCLYTAYDVTLQLVPGRNAVDVMLGNGMYNVPGGRYVKFTGSFGPPKVILQLYVEYADGTSTVVARDESWTWAPSRVVFSCIYGGEDYDARKEQPGWDKAGFDALAFHPVSAVGGPVRTS